MMGRVPGDARPEKCSIWPQFAGRMQRSGDFARGLGTLRPVGGEVAFYARHTSTPSDLRNSAADPLPSGMSQRTFPLGETSSTRPEATTRAQIVRKVQAEHRAPAEIDA
jgi:hypothetical protein